MATQKKSNRSGRKKVEQGQLDLEDQILCGDAFDSASSYYRTAGISMPGFGSYSRLQRFRGGFDRLSLKKKFQVSRWLSYYNWFVAPFLAHWNSLPEPSVSR